MSTGFKPGLKQAKNVISLRSVSTRKLRETFSVPRDKLARPVSLILAAENQSMDEAGAELLARLVEEHTPALVLYARQWRHNPEDVVQNVLVRLMRERTLPGNLVGWLYRAVRNEAINSSRSAMRRRRHEAAAGTLGQNWFVPRLGDEVDGRIASEALASLGPQERETIILRLWGKLSFEEIAAQTGISKSTAHRRFLTGIAAMRERLGIPCPNKDTT